LRSPATDASARSPRRRRELGAHPFPGALSHGSRGLGGARISSVPLSIALVADGLALVNRCGFPLLARLRLYYLGAEERRAAAGADPGIAGRSVNPSGSSGMRSTRLVQGHQLRVTGNPSRANSSGWRGKPVIPASCRRRSQTPSRRRRRSAPRPARRRTPLGRVARSHGWARAVSGRVAPSRGCVAKNEPTASEPAIRAHSGGMVRRASSESRATIPSMSTASQASWNLRITAASTCGSAGLWARASVCSCRSSSRRRRARWRALLTAAVLSSSALAASRAD
jgi:hypothetical protein